MAWKLSKIGNLSNLSEVILNYEVSPLQTSLKKRRTQLISRIAIQVRNFDWLCFESYWGLLKSLVAFLLPWSLIIYVKSIPNVKTKTHR